MAIGSSIGIFKILGIFGTIFILLIWLAPIVIGLGRAMITGDWRDGLKVSGGRLFVIDATLKEETDIMLTNEEPIHKQVFHLVYSLSLVFMLFFIFFLLYKFGNWIVGLQKFSPSTDILITLLIIGLFLLIEFLYAYIILKVTIIPLKDGVIHFIINLPKIVMNMFTV